MARRKPSDEWDNKTDDAGDNNPDWDNVADGENEESGELGADKKTIPPKSGPSAADEEDIDELADDDYINEALDDDENLE